jgi:DNA replication protein DnaC
METNLLVREYLKRLRLPTMARELDRCAAEAAERGVPYERFLQSLAELEVAQREDNMQRARLAGGHFPVLKTLDTFDFSLTPGLPRQRLLQLAQGDFLDRAENVVAIGTVGTGKTHLLTALGVALCRSGRRVRFFTAAGLINTMQEALAAHSMSKLEKFLDTFHLVIVDELGYVPFGKGGAELLFNFVANRYERKSIAISSNLEFSAWSRVLGEPQMTAAMVDRLTHRCQILVMNFESYRFRHSQTAAGLAGTGEASAPARSRRSKKSAAVVTDDACAQDEEETP